MATPCYNCGGNLADLSGTAQIKKIERLIADNYTIIGICIVITLGLSFIIWYFGSQIYETIKNYKKSVIKYQGTDTTAQKLDLDNEVYDEDGAQPTDITKYFDSGKQDFVKTMDNAYKDYNTLKTDYLRTYNKSENDDVVNKDTIFYRKYDDYTYKKPENE